MTIDNDTYYNGDVWCSLGDAARYIVSDLGVDDDTEPVDAVVDVVDELTEMTVHVVHELFAPCLN